MSLSPQWLDQLRGRITLSSLIGRSVKVQKAGREYKACCPFHSEKTPSFTINDQKGFYHCFGCGAHGDAIRWMTDHRGLGFMDAVKELASEAGMDVPAPDPQAAQRAEKRTTLFDVCASAQDWFVEQLDTVEGAAARAYLEKRGISAETQRAFGFGFAPDGRGNIAKALDGFPQQQLVEAGLLIQVEGKTPYDRFRGRLMLPIKDARGRVIAFGGRILGDGEPKYLNSPDTPLFDKGRTLYNLDKAAAASRKTGRLLVVEGYMDAIALAQAGFEDVVAPLGTALTEEQIAMAWKMAERPILCLDGDNAGQKAAMRAASRALPMLRAGHSLAFAELPAGKDPDDVLNELGVDAFDRILSNAYPLSQFLWLNEHKQLAEGAGPDDRAQLKAKMREYAAMIEDQSIAAEYSSTLLSMFFDHYGFKKRNMNKFKIISVSTIMEPSKLANLNVRDAFIKAICLGLSRYPSVIRTCIDDLNDIMAENNDYNIMLGTIIDIAFDEPSVSEDMLEQMWVQSSDIEFEGRDYQRDLAFRFYFKLPDKSKPERELKEVIKALVRDVRFGKAVKRYEAAWATSLSSDDTDAIQEASHKKLQALKKSRMENQARMQELIYPEMIAAA